MRCCLPLLLPFLLGGQALHASGLSISKVRLDETDFGRMSFTVSWQHAWNLDSSTAPGNHDAAWVFLKHSNFTGWTHLPLSSASLHRSSSPDRLRVEAVPDGAGVFLVPSFSGAGDIDSVEVTVEFAQPFGYLYQKEFLVVGIEMVHVPEGPFYLGDIASNSSFRDAGDARSYWVDSEWPISIGSEPGDLAPDSVSSGLTMLPAEWPKGYAGFYCMKYEISQQQYADFLNVLNWEQRANRTAVTASSPEGSFVMGAGLNNRNGLRLHSGDEILLLDAPGVSHDLQADGSYNGADDGQNRACNWLSWDDLCAYLDWACLRPMSEFEFEKACRGPLTALPLEFAWGTDEVVDANTLVADGTALEGVEETVSGNEGLASHGYVGPQGPLRCGFAAGSSTNRLQAGSSYYGIMELSGNLWEQCVVVRLAGQGFRAETGDGVLDADGFADVPSWPGASGAGHRGGAWNSGVLPGFRDLAVSDRFYVGLAPVNRRNTVGGRGLR